MLPHLSLPLEASEEDLRACLIDGTVLCSVLNKLCPGLIEMVGLPSVLFVYNLFGYVIILRFMTFFFWGSVSKSYCSILTFFFSFKNVSYLERQFGARSPKCSKVLGSYQ